MTVRCCKGGPYAGHAFECGQPGYVGPPPLPGHAFCSCGRWGGNFCWRGLSPARGKARGGAA